MIRKQLVDKRELCLPLKDDNNLKITKTMYCSQTRNK